MKCWKCGETLDLIGKMGFREECEKCHAYQHVCCNCKHYRPGMSNDCEIPDTDFVVDRQSANFCEDFKPVGKQVGKVVDPDDVAKRLFGDD